MLGKRLVCILFLEKNFVVDLAINAVGTDDNESESSSFLDENKTKPWFWLILIPIVSLLLMICCWYISRCYSKEGEKIESAHSDYSFKYDKSESEEPDIPEKIEKHGEASVVFDGEESERRYS